MPTQLERDMNDLDGFLTQNLANAIDRYDAHMGQGQATSMEDLKRLFPATMEMMLAQWAASLDIKSRHDLMKSSIDAIK